ncbi:dedicator of cytokinesis protein 3-like [Patiria miniata]|uniref:DOCKER domain-containing protein n=1 Tax=Patiria miniata TaxID=46514 RepID=A0A914B0A8_PATMI|nr:dedicator of cytokinesis protein 3-like [Patiria miniata]
MSVFLLNLLKWKAHPQRLKETLHRITKVGGQEIVRVLQDILDALFNILDERAADFERDVFDALVYILGILGDTRFKSFTTVLDTYIENFFASTQAHMFLVKELKRYIDNSMIEKAEIVVSTLKAVQNLFKFIFRSHVLYQRATGDFHDGNIQDSMRCLFGSMNKLMTHTEDKLQLQQLILLKNFSHIATELRVMYSTPEVSQFIIELLEHMPVKDLPPEVLKAKLVFLSETIDSNLFKESMSRKFLLEPSLKQLRLHIENREESGMCVNILSSMLASLYKISKTESVDADVSIIVKLLLESILNMVMSLDWKTNTAVLCISCLLDLLRLMKESHYQELKASLREQERHREFLKKTMRVFKELSAKQFYQVDWMAMRMLANSVILVATRRVSIDLSSTFLTADNANVESMQSYSRASGGENWLERRVGYELWFDYFRLACVFITQPCLQLDTMTPAKRDRILNRYGDMRVDMAQEIVSKWQSLGDHKSLFRNLTRPFLEVTMVRQAEIRRIILPIIFDIMCCEKLERGNFNQLEDDLIDKLDTMVCVEKKGDENYTVLFNQVLLECIASQPWREEGEQFVDKVKRLLERLIDYRNVADTSVENRHLRLNCMYNLMNFYKDDANREDIYARYIYRLRDLHLESNDYTEAAFTLLVLATSLEWRDKLLQSDDKHPQQSEMQRKEALYHEIINLMDKGEMWEFGIPLCKELSVQYESKLFDYGKNSRILQAQASFFDNILQKQRPTPTYFRVTFYGNFPLKSKAWIYRGRPFEQLGTLFERLQSDFPRAKNWQKNEPPTSADLQNNHQYLQVRAVDTVPTDNIFKDMNVPIRISSFYDTHRISKFKFDRPFHKGEKDPDNEFKTLYVEQTQLTIENTLPSLLRWADVIESETVEQTPIQNAVSVMENKNKAIRTITAEMYANPNGSINPLSMVLQGTIDAAVQGGPKKYKLAFLSNEYKKQHPEDSDLCLQLERLVSEQMQILTKGVNLHGQLRTDNLAQFQENLESKLAELRRDFGLSSGPIRTSTTPTSNAKKTAIFRKSVMPVATSPSGKPRISSEEPTGSSRFYLDSITESNAPVSPTQLGLADRRSSQDNSPIRRGRATIATTRQHTEQSSSRASKIVPSFLKKSDSSTSLPSDRSSSTSLPSPDISELGSPRLPLPEKLLKSPHKDRDVTNLLRETYKGPSQRNSSGSRPNSSSSVASTSSTSSRESGSTSEDPNIPPALPVRRPSQPTETSVPRTIILEPARPLPHELPENGEASPPPLPTKKSSIGGTTAIHPSRRRTDYDKAPPAIPVKSGRSHSLGGEVDSPRPSSGESEDAPPPIPSRPEKRSSTNPSHLDTLPSPLGQRTLEDIPGSPPRSPSAVSPPPPSIPPPELPENIAAAQAVEQLAGELKNEAHVKPKVPPPVPMRPKSRKGTASSPTDTNNV